MRKTRTILLVEDEILLRRSLQRTLARHDFHVLTAENSVTAWEILIHQKVDLCITDIVMSGESGLELLRKIREHEHAKELPVILHSAFSGNIRKNIDHLRPYFLLHKPVPIGKFVSTVRRALASAP